MIAFITQSAIDALLQYDGCLEVCPVDDKILEQAYQENLEERLIAWLSEQNDISLDRAMDIYYRSKLAEKIHQGIEGVQYLDYKVLAQIMLETEPDLFSDAHP